MRTGITTSSEESPARCTMNWSKRRITPLIVAREWTLPFMSLFNAQYPLGDQVAKRIAPSSCHDAPQLLEVFANMVPKRK
jgi:hypothetical protein